ncbi:hypothetical protein EPR50_G00081900 [Perca flavescens]|uniref:CCHC-type domain-containing protein n=1 Tax=Perca flavescens TaxID=8167 RepID=A0A484D6P4_PERFV|nr:hypothetical protein EPR50_G00081900 [Perca flavescens]
MAMSQALSEEEFHRMQAQLLELRTQNYQLSDDLRKNSAELNAVRQKNVVLERDFVKAQKALNKSKKAQEVDALLSENEMLQGETAQSGGRLQATEQHADDRTLQVIACGCQLQSRWLLLKTHSQPATLSNDNTSVVGFQLCTQIEELEQENQGLKEGGATSASSAPPNPTSSPVDGEMLRLQAENSTLQKQMKALQERYDKELQKQAVAQGNQSATTETDGSAGANGVSDVTGRGEEPAAEGTNERLEQTEAQLENTEKQLHGLSEKSVEKIVAKQAALGWSAALCPITHCFGPELEMALNTEQEEKRLLREQILNLEVSPLSVPSTRITVSGVPPFIPDELLGNELQRFGKFASGFKTVTLGCKDPKLRHVQSLRRQVFMFLDSPTQTLEVSFRVKHGQGSYMVYASSGQLKCFECGDVGHKRFACPHRQQAPTAGEAAAPETPAADEAGGPGADDVAPVTGPM